MKNNFFFIQKSKGHLIAFLVLFCGLFANTISAQVVYTWNAAVGVGDGRWETPANWSSALPGTVPGNDPGDIVVISNGATVTYFDSKTISKLTLSNLSGPASGSTLIIEADALLTVNSGGVSGPVIINGGNIVNNGNLSVISSSPSGTLALQSFVIGNPATAVVGGPFTYGYTGGAVSTLTINLNAPLSSTSSAAFQISATTANSNSKISLVFNGFNEYISNNKRIFAIRTSGGVAPLSIGGTTFNANTALLSLSTGSDTTIESGTVLSSSVDVNGQYNIIIASSATATSTFTNKGTIDIFGATSGFSGIALSCPPSTNGSNLTFDNQGTILVDLACEASTRAPFHILSSGGSRGQINITNSGTMTLKNPTTAPGAGFAFLANNAINTPNVDFVNNGTLNLSGSNFVEGGQVQTAITNNGTINSNQELRSLTLLNNSGKTISFVQDLGTLGSTNALSTGLTFATNNGIIQTATGATLLNNLTRVSALSSTSSIEPGGATGKGIASFSGASFPLSGTFKLQVAGNTAAGTDYDQVTNVLTNGGFTISPSAVLDVTGISGTSTPVDVIVANGTGTINGTFASVVGLAPGWAVNYATAGRVQLVYNATLSVNDSQFNENSVSVYKNNGALYVNSGAVEINNIKVYDLLGKLLVEQKNVKSASASINNLKAINQVLIVKIAGNTNEVVTKKVVF